MSAFYFYGIVICLTLGTFLIRWSFIALSHRMEISPQLRQLFTFIPAAIFPALFVPATFFHQGQVAWLQGKERFAVLVVATVASFFVRGTLFVIAFGLGLLFAISHIL